MSYTEEDPCCTRFQTLMTCKKKACSMWSKQYNKCGELIQAEALHHLSVETGRVAEHIQKHNFFRFRR